MNNLSILFFFAISVAGCNTTTNKNMNDKPNKPKQIETVTNDTTAKVTGIGGIFFSFEKSKRDKGMVWQKLRTCN